MSVPSRPLPGGPAVMRQKWRDLLAGFDPESRPPDHALHSPGVDVRVYPLRRSFKPASA